MFSLTFVLAIVIFVTGTVTAGYVTTSLMTHNVNLAAWAGVGVAFLTVIIVAAVASTEPDW